ncbi:hypothetical protein BKE38_23725 [Pseudoroseomonas deserti]|uniref:Uncharacterized protein n=1 Tax=Teichococcus deserti TaxID=1817963 RepID=A0A1V2GVZ6_9PROT|nr:hypothetical protein [Pseudoroseomonas deserti]ONG47363.1 hypothetical protein BKE38_23725 [Pseudoroseomonas deserti]
MDLTGLLVILGAMLTGIAMLAVLGLCGLSALALRLRDRPRPLALYQAMAGSFAAALPPGLVVAVTFLTDGDGTVQPILGHIEAVWPLSLVLWLGFLVLVWWAGARLLRRALVPAA